MTPSECFNMESLDLCAPIENLGFVRCGDACVPRSQPALCSQQCDASQLDVRVANTSLVNCSGACLPHDACVQQIARLDGRSAAICGAVGAGFKECNGTCVARELCEHIGQPCSALKPDARLKRQDTPTTCVPAMNGCTPDGNDRCTMLGSFISCSSQQIIAAIVQLGFAIDFATVSQNAVALG